MSRTAVAVVTCFVVGCAFSSMAFASSFSARFSWKGIPACSSVSPAFSISGVPPGTAALAFALHDREAPDFQHGGSTVAYTGKGVVSRGAITYVGPCPPSGTTHRYVWTIEALDGEGATLGSTNATGSFGR